jgi:disulfide bond formation protein DsbB
MTSIIIQGLAALTLIGNIFIVVSILYFLIRLIKKINCLEKILDFLGHFAFTGAFIVALIATAGSLYFSEVARLTPCELCWFQRIFMYPQALTLLIALIYKDRRVKKYIMPMSLIGGGISIYNYYLQIFPPAVSTCSINSADSCSRIISMYYGYITFSFMALTASTLIFILMMLGGKTDNNKNLPIN